MRLNLTGIMLLVGFMSVATVSAKAENLASYGSNNVIETSVLPTAGEQDFDLVNKTGLEIVALYISEHDDDKWGDDVLGIETLPTGRYTTITFSGYKATDWDLRVDDADGNSHELFKVNLKEIETIELFYKNGEFTSTSY